MWSALVVLIGCVAVRNTESVNLDGAGVSVVSAVIDAGDLTYVGTGRGQFDVAATTWGTGSNREKAAAREATVTWSAEVDGYTLLLDGLAPEVQSGVDFDVTGPDMVSIVADLRNGDARLDSVEGFHSIAAGSVSGFLLGDFEVFADSTVDLSFVPYEATDTLIEATGGVTLAIPWGLSYDLTVRTSPDQAISVDDLGWQDLVLGEGFVNGFSGFGDVEIDINTSGPVTIYAL